MKVVANIVIEDFGPPPVIIVEGTDEIVHVGESVKVFFPNIWIRDRLMPRISLEIGVNKREDQQPLSDFMFLVQTNMEEYKTFWENRKREAETGIFMP